jgi:hypothetical protein
MPRKLHYEEYITVGRIFCAVIVFVVSGVLFFAREEYRINKLEENYLAFKTEMQQYKGYIDQTNAAQDVNVRQFESEVKVDIKDISNKVDDILKILISQRAVHR